MKNSVDVVVIGGGVAGAVAAAHASSQGLSVIVVHKSKGASAYSSGAIDVADSKMDEVPGVNSDPFARGEGWFKSAERLILKQPRHPYARQKDNLEKLQASLSVLMDLTQDLPLVARDDGHNHVVVTQTGTVKRCALVQKSLHFDVSALRDKDCVGVVEIDELLCFEAAPVVDMLKWINSIRGLSFDVVPVKVKLDLPRQGMWKSFLEAAFAFDDVEMQKALAQAVRRSLKSLSVNPNHLLFPAMLSTHKPLAVLNLVQEMTSLPASELLALPHSLPGLRLSESVSRGLHRKGVTSIEGKVEQYAHDRGHIISLTVAGAQGTIELSPQAIILASGRVLGGGIVSDGTCHESIFGLPAWTHRGPVSDRFSLDMTQATSDQDHEIFRMGVAYDNQLRPLNQFGELFASNLFAAGSILEGYDPAKDGTGIGVAAWTGYVAAMHASNAIAEHRKN